MGNQKQLRTSGLMDYVHNKVSILFFIYVRFLPKASSVVWKRWVSESSFFELLYIGDFVFSPELNGR